MSAVIKMRGSMAFDSTLCEKVDGLPVAFRIWKFGINPTDKDGKVVNVNVTKRAIGLLLEEQARRGNRYSFDVDHMSLSQNAPPEARRGMGSHLLAARGTSEEPELWTDDCRWTEFAAAGLRQAVPEWLSSSPAFDISANTLEPVSYTNTSLTNNPATHNATVFASLGFSASASSDARKINMDEGVLSALKAAIAALQDVLAKAQPVAAAEVPPAPAPAAEVKAAEPPPAAHAEPDGDECKATITASAVDLGLVARVHALESELSKRNEAEERVRLLASRKDFGADTLKSLEKASIENVRFAVATFPKSANLAAVVSVQATRGEGQGETVSALPADEAEQLKIRMGVKETVRACRKTGNVMTFGVSVPKESK